MVVSQASIKRRYEAGRGTGCVLSVLVVLVVLCFAAFIIGRVVAKPDLGAPVAGPDHGDTASAVSLKFGQIIAVDLLAHQHTVITLSEHDLTVIASDRNPDPEKFSNPEVRIRDGELLLSASTSVGPLNAVAVAHVSLSLTGVSNGDAHIASEITELDLGRETVPDFMRAAVDPRGNGALSLDPMFNDSSQLKGLRANLECIAIGPNGVRLGFHRPGVAPDPTSCVAPAVSNPAPTPSAHA